MAGWATTQRALLFLVPIVGASLVLVTRADAYEVVVGPPKEEVVSWSLWRTPGSDGRRVITLRVTTGYCLGEPPPVAGPVKVVEKPIGPAFPRPTAIITAHQILPKPVEVSGKVMPGEPIPVCAGLGYDLEKRVRLRRPVKDMVFYDGSTHPPRLVKPLHGG